MKLAMCSPVPSTEVRPSWGELLFWGKKLVLQAPFSTLWFSAHLQGRATQVLPCKKESIAMFLSSGVCSQDLCSSCDNEYLLCKTSAISWEIQVRQEMIILSQFPEIFWGGCVCEFRDRERKSGCSTVFNFQDVPTIIFGCRGLYFILLTYLMYFILPSLNTDTVFQWTQWAPT